MRWATNWRGLTLTATGVTNDPDDGCTFDALLTNGGDDVAALLSESDTAELARQIGGEINDYHDDLAAECLHQRRADAQEA